MAHTLPPLPYPADALEPYIDARTMEIHHDKHHNAYLTKLNAAIEGTAYESQDPEDVLRNFAALPEELQLAVRNQGGGYVNHNLFWDIMGPNGGGEPGGDLGKAISGAFGSFQGLKETFTKAALGRFGSGWAWLVVDGDKNLKVYSTANQDSPLMDGNTPILGLDVWEHAYYLNYQNRRPDYVEAWWNVVNWSAVTERCMAAMA